MNLATTHNWSWTDCCSGIYQSRMNYSNQPTLTPHATAFVTKEVPPSAYIPEWTQNPFPACPKGLKHTCKIARLKQEPNSLNVLSAHLRARNWCSDPSSNGPKNKSKLLRGILQNEISQCMLMKAQFTFLNFVSDFLLRASSWTENLSSDWA